MLLLPLHSGQTNRPTVPLEPVGVSIGLNNCRLVTNTNNNEKLRPNSTLTYPQILISFAKLLNISIAPLALPKTLH